MLKRLSILALLFASLCGCNSDGAPLEFLIDNPTDSSITLSIDDHDYPVAANAETPVQLSPGEHHLRSERLGDVRVIVYARQRGGLINPTLSDYVVVINVYAIDEDKAKHFGARNVRVEFGDIAFHGPFKKTHDLFIDKDWSFGVHEPFPDVLRVRHIDKIGGEMKSKIFAAIDFIHYMEDASGQSGEHLKHNPAGFQQPVYTLEPAPADLPPLDPDYEAHAGPLRKLYARYLNATAADEQVQLQKEIFKADTAMRQTAESASRKLSVQARETQEQFALAFMHVLSRSALVVPAR